MAGVRHCLLAKLLSLAAVERMMGAEGFSTAARKLGYDYTQGDDQGEKS